MSNRTIKTARLILRPVTVSDAPRIAELGGDWDVASMTSRMPYPYTLDSAHQWIEGLANGEKVFAIEREGVLIGITGFTATPDGTSAEVGYWLGKSYWRQGIATEAAHALINHCFKKEGLRTITCGHFDDNPASARVIEKLGFDRIGTSQCWCEARRLDRPAIRYELNRPQTLWRRLKQLSSRQT